MRGLAYARDDSLSNPVELLAWNRAFAKARFGLRSDSRPKPSGRRYPVARGYVRSIHLTSTLPVAKIKLTIP